MNKRNVSSRRVNSKKSENERNGKPRPRTDLLPPLPSKKKPPGWTSDGPPKASCYGSPVDAGGGGPGGFFPWNGDGIVNPPESPSTLSTNHCDDAARRGRAVADAHLAACLAAGLSATGCRAEEACGQWSFSLGPLPPLEAADQLWAARWLLHAVVSSTSFTSKTRIDPSKPSPPLVAVTDALPRHLAKFTGRCWDGNGCRVTFSTRATRSSDSGSGDSAEASPASAGKDCSAAGNTGTTGTGVGRAALRSAIERLAAAHASHMIVYGAGAALRCEAAAERRRRMCSANEDGGKSSPSPPPSPTTPTEVEAPPSPPPPLLPPPHPHHQRFAGVEDPAALLRIPAAVALHGRGHLEDRRPAGGCDPYMAFTLLLCTTLGLPLPFLPAGGNGASPAPAAAAPLAVAAKAAKRAREEGGGAALARQRSRRAAPAASVAAMSGSGENQHAHTNAPAAAAASLLLACDEQVAESAQDGGEGLNNGDAAAGAAAVEASDLLSDGDDGDDGDDDDLRSSALLLAADDEDCEDDDDCVSTPLTPTRDVGGATTVAGPDNRERRSGGGNDLDDDATSSSSNGGR